MGRIQWKWNLVIAAIVGLVLGTPSWYFFERPDLGFWSALGSFLTTLLMDLFSKKQGNGSGSDRA
jgi:hypothetical protein